MKKDRVILPLVVIILFQLLSFLIYGESLRYPFVGEDYYLISEVIQKKYDFGQAWFKKFDTQNYYRPLGYYMLRIDFLLAGLNPYFYHLVNIVLHGLNSTLIFFMVYLLLRGSLLISLSPALFFMVHPINSVVCYWVTQIPELLCSFFVLLTIISYYNYLNLLPKKSFYLAFSLLFCLFAFGSKEQSTVLPLLILMCDIWHLPKHPIKNRIKRILPFFLLLGLFMLLRAFVLKGFFLGGYNVLHIFTTLSIAIKKLVFPVRIILSHASYVYASGFSLIAISIFPILFKNKNVIFSLLWFFISILVLHNLPAFPSNNLYLQNIGFCLFVSFITEFYTKLFFKKKQFLKTLALAGTIFILLSTYTMLTIKRNTYAQRASATADKFVKGVLKIYPEYPRGSIFYFINVPYLLAENQILATSKIVASALSLNYGIYYERIPVHIFTYMEDTLKVKNEVEVEVIDDKTLIVTSRDAYLVFRPWEVTKEYISIEKIDSANIYGGKDVIAAKKFKITLKDKIKESPQRHFFYFTNGTIYELKNF